LRPFRKVWIVRPVLLDELELLLNARLSAEEEKTAVRMDLLVGRRIPQRIPYGMPLRRWRLASDSPGGGTGDSLRGKTFLIWAKRGVFVPACSVVGRTNLGLAPASSAIRGEVSPHQDDT
jgi:hypothetical protein